MRSGTSYFNATVFKKTILRFWPLWTVYLVIWAIILPLNALMSLRLDGNDYIQNFVQWTLPEAAQACLPFAVVFGVLSAMAVCSHLYNSRSANFFGSLPVRREGLFITHYLAGLCFLIVPNLAIFLLTLLVELAGGMLTWSTLLFWLAVSCGECLLFYSMAVFCGMFTGHLLALPVFYAILNFLVMGVMLLFQTVLQAFYYGFDSLSAPVIRAAEWFTPIYKLGDDLSCWWSSTNNALYIEGLDIVGIYALAGLVLPVCSFFLYRARRLESAGDVVAVRPMQPVFKYGVAVCMGMAFGIFTSFFLNLWGWGLMIAIVIWGLVGCFAAQMLLDKSFRVFHKWKGAAAVTGAFVLLFLVMNFDLTGFETRVPDPASVESVYVSGLNMVYLNDSGDYLSETITEPGRIELITTLHQAAVEQRDEQDWPQRGRSMYLRYTLKNGTTMTREYIMHIDATQVDQPGSAAWTMERLYSDREFYWQVYSFDELHEWLDRGGRLSNAILDPYDGNPGRYFYGKDAAALLDAVEADYWAGRIGVRHVTNDDIDWDELYALRFTVEWNEYNASSSDSASDSAFDSASSVSVSICVQDTASETLAVLERLEGAGVVSDSDTQCQVY